jgi:hypothetical protein
LLAPLEKTSWRHHPGAVQMPSEYCYLSPNRRSGLSRGYNLPFRCDPHTIPMSLAPNNPLRTQCTIHARARITFCLDGF